MWKGIPQCEIKASDVYTECHRTHMQPVYCFHKSVYWNMLMLGYCSLIYFCYELPPPQYESLQQTSACPECGLRFSALSAGCVHEAKFQHMEYERKTSVHLLGPAFKQKCGHPHSCLFPHNMDKGSRWQSSSINRGWSFEKTETTPSPRAVYM